MTGPAPTYFAYRTPLGHVTIASDGQALTALAFGERELEGRKLATELTNRAANQLQEYLAGRRRAFDLPLAPAGTEFQRRVWAALREVPYGQARSYSDVAAAIGSPRSCQMCIRDRSPPSGPRRARRPARRPAGPPCR